MIVMIIMMMNCDEKNEKNKEGVGEKVERKEWQ